MVKNLPSVERSTQIRFGKNVPDATEQAENTVIFNASNDTVPTPYSNAVYLSPIRNRTDYQAPEIVLLMYDRNTKEITESGESANALIGGSTLDTVTNRNNATSNVVQFIGSLTGASFVTDSNVGLSNLLPQHTVSVGSNLYIDEFGSNVLVVSGNVAVLRDMVIDGNLRVNGDTTVIYTENTSIKDAFIELGRDNTSGDTTLDLGVLMHRPDALSNVVVGYREGTDEFAIAYTEAKPTDKTFVPKTDEDINVHVYGRVLTEANVGIINTSPIHTLDVGSNLYIDDLASNILVVRGNVDFFGDLTVTENVYIEEDLLVVGNTYVSKDLRVTENVFVTKDLTVSENVFVSNNITVIENALVSKNLTVTKDLTVSGNVFVSNNLTVTENAFVSNNLTVTKDLTVSENVFVSNNLMVTKNVLVSNILTVTGNTHLVGPNVFVTHTMDFLDPTTAIVTDQVSNVQIRLGQLENVSNTASNPLDDQVLMYDGGEWTNIYPNHSFLKIKNDSLSTMVSGNAVYVSGYQNENLAKVKLAKADSPTTMPSIGIVYSTSIAPGEEGLAVAYGKVNQINTNGYNVGETLYVSNLYAGWISNVKPYYTDSQPNLIQNLGVVTRKDTSHGAMFVTGIGRANDIPNAELITDYNEMNYVYVNDTNNDLKKITSANLNIPLTTAVSSSSNSAANAVTLRGVSITSGDGFHGDLVVAGNVTVDTSTLKVDAEANRVGILTVSPGYPLDVRGSISTDDYLIHNGDTNTKIGFSGDDTFVVNTNGTEQLKIDTNGNTYVTSNLTVDTNTLHIDSISNRVGILTTLPGQALDVRGAANVGTFTTTTGTVTDGTHSTSKDTGVLVLTQGGLGVEANIHSTNVFATSHIAVGTSATSNTFDVRGTANVGALTTESISITDTTHSTSKDTGAFILTNGGLGVEANIHSTNVFAASHIGVGTSATTKAFDVRGAANVGTFTTTTGTVTDATHSTSKDTGVLVLTQGGLGVEANIHSTNVFAASHIAVGTSETSNTFDVRGTANVGALVTTSTHISDDTTSTTTTSGALQVRGGVSTQENLNVGGVTKVWDSTNAGNKTSGALQVTGGVGVQGDLYATDGHFSTDVSVGSLTNKKIPYANASKILTDSQISQEDGTVVISGDVEISGSLLVQGESFEVSAGQLVVQDRIIDIANNTPDHDLDIGILMEHPGHNIGLIHHPEDYFVMGYTQNGYSDTHILRDYSNEFTLNVWEYVTTQNTVTIEHNDLYIKDGLIGVNTDSPLADLHVVGNAFVTSNITTSSNVLITGDAAATSKTTGALQVAGGVGISGDIHATHANLEDVEADSVTVTDTTTSTSITTGALKVAGGVSTQEKLNVGGITKVWDSTVVTSKTDGALVVVGGVGISGDIHATHANLEDVEADSVTVTDTTTSSSTTTGALKVAGGVSTQEKLNVGGVTKIWDSTAVTGKTDGALVVVGGVGISGDIHATHANLEDVEADSVTVTDTTPSTSKASGALQVAGGVGISGALHGSTADLDGVVTLTDTTEATSSTTGALKAAGGVGIAKDVYVGERAYVTGGLVTNTGGVTKKTYSFSGDLTNAQTIANSTIKITFSAHVFYAKIVAHLVESDDEVSTLSMECGGGHWTGGTPLAIAKGPVTIFGSASTNPWSSAITTTTTEVSFKPTTDMAVAGHYNVFIEYISQSSSGTVTKITEGSTDVVTFGY